MAAGPERRHDAITDVRGVRVGHWTDRRALTGCTVVLPPSGSIAGVDVRGAAPGTRETDLLRPGNLVQEAHAFLLTGGSAFGLDAATGVMRWCAERGVGLAFGGHTVPIVPAAVIFDLGIGRADLRPDAAAGYAAAAAAKGGRVSQGNAGAGAGATVAKILGPSRALKGGLGSASEALAGGLIVGAVMVVNAGGEVVDSAGGRVIAGPRGEEPGRFVSALEALRSAPAPERPGNTTIGVVATNARLTKEQANRLATVAHDGIARAVRPAHTRSDGDTLFAFATGERDCPPELLRGLEALAALAVERAIVKAVLAARSAGGVPAARDWTAGPVPGASSSSRRRRSAAGPGRGGAPGAPASPPP
jgi:L-aminopeptidase/D-esterase-like protein